MKPGDVCYLIPGGTLWAGDPLQLSKDGDFDIVEDYVPCLVVNRDETFRCKPPVVLLYVLARGQLCWVNEAMCVRTPAPRAWENATEAELAASD